MSLFDRIFRPDKAKEMEKALKDARGFFKTLTSAIDARARHISKLKPQFNGTANQPLQSKMRLAPNQWQTWSQFLYRTSTILDVTNNCFIVPVMDDRMITTGYYTVLPQRCELIDYKGEPWLRYKFSNGQVGAVEFSKCATLTKHQYQRDFFGDSNAALDETMKLIHIQNQGIEEGVKNAATFRFMATLNNFASDDDLAKERARFTRENLSSDSEAGGFLLFPNTYKDIKQIDVKPWTVDAEQMKAIYSNVANYFGVSEEVMQNKAKTEELEAFFDGAIEPFAIQFSESMTAAMFTQREREMGTTFSVNANRLQYMSVQQKVQMAQQLLDRGVMSINEARLLFNYEEVDGGDIRPIRGEYKPADEETQNNE